MTPQKPYALQQRFEAQLVLTVPPVELTTAPQLDVLPTTTVTPPLDGVTTSFRVPGDVTPTEKSIGTTCRENPTRACPRVNTLEI